jgi:hypothetical protein
MLYQSGDLARFRNIGDNGSDFTYQAFLNEWD